MADKDFLLGNKARELLRYTNQATRVVSDDVSPKDVRAIIRRIASVEDIRDVGIVCSEVSHALDTGRDREGFTKSTFRLYGSDMREIAKCIVRDIQSANNMQFVTEYDQRIAKIEDVLDGCSMLMEYIQLCLDEKIISLKKAGVWTKKATDVKYMAAAWKKSDSGRAKKLREEAAKAEYRRQYDLMLAACREANRGK